MLPVDNMKIFQPPISIGIPKKMVTKVIDFLQVNSIATATEEKHSRDIISLLRRIRLVM